MVRFVGLVLSGVGGCGQLSVLTVVLLGYLGVLALLRAVLPGPTIAGALLADKTRLYYKCNGDDSLLFMFFSSSSSPPPRM